MLAKASVEELAETWVGVWELAMAEESVTASVAVMARMSGYL